MRRPTSPPPRRSQDSRPDSPKLAELRRSSSDVSYRPNRFLAKLKGGSASSGSTTTASGASKLPTRSHSRTRSITTLSPPSPTPNTSTNTIASPKASNSSVKSAREMHRLGTIPAQVALAPAMTAAASASSISLASTVATNATTSGTSTTDPWHMLHVHVLPLFNGEALSIPIEELNQLVKKRIASVVSRSPSRAISTLEQDVVGLLNTGMITLSVKLSDVKLSELKEDKRILRVVEVWDFFWHQVLPYVEGVFHPLQTDNLMQTLSRTPKTHRSSSPTLPEEAPTTSPQSINVRTLALRSFRDSILLPIYPRLNALLSTPRKDKESAEDTQTYNHPRLQQMLLVLASTAQHSPSLTPSPPPSQGESAVTHLLRAIRSPRAGDSARPFGVTRLPSFFAGSAPRDRRGRIARKSVRYTTLNLAEARARRSEDGDGADDETPRNSGFGDERDRERAFLESLRSPELDVEEPGGVGAGAGGWGLGGGQEHHSEDEDEDEEAMDWDQAQDVVERMVGLRA